jgi:ureidoacrylate peracid hydrolase
MKVKKTSLLPTAVALPPAVKLRFKPKTTALLLIDLQRDFLSPGGAYARAGAVSPMAAALPRKLLPLVQAFKGQGSLVAASLFTLWPDAHGEPMISPHLKKLRPFLARGDFAPGSKGQALVPTLQSQVDVCVNKVAYSAFFNTQLDWVLRRNGVDTLLIAGIVTNGGVASTARDAHMRDYQVMVLADGCAAFSEEAHQTSLKDMGTLAQVIRIEQALAAL